MPTDAKTERRRILRKLCAQSGLTPSRVQALLYATEQERGHYKRLLHDRHDVADWLTAKGYLAYELDMSTAEIEEARQKVRDLVADAIAAIASDWKLAFQLLQAAQKLENTIGWKVYRITADGREAVEPFRAAGFTAGELRYQI